ncbi:MAG: hypothetical protein AB7O39_14000 [Flavobacteriaceae bacterium]
MAIHAAAHNQKRFEPVRIAGTIVLCHHWQEANMTRSKTLNTMVLGFAFLFVAAIVLGTM